MTGDLSGDDIDIAGDIPPSEVPLLAIELLVPMESWEMRESWDMVLAVVVVDLCPFGRCGVTGNDSVETKVKGQR